MADDEETKLLWPIPPQRRRPVAGAPADCSAGLSEEGDVFLDGEAADITEDVVAVVGVAVALGGMEEVGVDAAGHEVAGAVGGVFEEAAEIGVGREEHLGGGVEAGDDSDGEIFNFLAGGGGLARGEHAERTTWSGGRRTRGRWCASLRRAECRDDGRDHAPMMPISLGPVMWMRSGLKR